MNDNISDDTKEIMELLVQLSVTQLRALLAMLRQAWPMDKRKPDEHAFLLGLARWIDERGALH